MLTLPGEGQGRFCDGISRCNFLRIGALSLGGLALPDILRAQAQSGALSKKAIIMIFLPGGPPHQDMFDLKTEAPSEIRGEFSPIRTNVPGSQICELLPRMAGRMDKLAIIRSVVGATTSHASFQCMTGWDPRGNQPSGGWPALGSVLSKLRGPLDPALPPYVGLAPKMGHVPWSDPGKPGFLGPSHASFLPNGHGKGDLILNGISLERLRDRRALLNSFDRFRREADASGLMEGFDAFTQQVFGVLTSSRLAEALDLEREDPKLRDRYGRGTAANQLDGGPKLLDQFLLARRLVEAGVCCVTLAFSRWDWHSNNFKRGREDMPMLDQGVTALVEDLHQRGLDKDVSVIVWGEFGRTPKINPSGGRDHWPAGLLCSAGLWGNAHGTGHRFNRPPWRRGQRPPSAFSGGVRHPLPEPGYRYRKSHRPRLVGPASLPGREPVQTHTRTHLTGQDRRASQP